MAALLFVSSHVVAEASIDPPRLHHWEASGSSGIRISRVWRQQRSKTHVWMQDEGVRLVLEEIDQHNNIMLATIRSVAQGPLSATPVC